MNRIIIGCDHGGFIRKSEIIKHLESRGFQVTDVGTYTQQSCDYPEIAKQVCGRIQGGEFELGILVCGTGIGMSIAANKHNGIRAACCSDTFSARMTRMHNNANVLCLGERTVGMGLALDIVDAFIENSFEGERHQRRVSMIHEIEKENSST
ncbi:MAG: ribose 5-phosphate isomerase B [Ruminococcaceae bacterium]|nr:ribose 5-phosphate isomerase B [Oscillospiraceae bacterium]